MSRKRFMKNQDRAVQRRNNKEMNTLPSPNGSPTLTKKSSNAFGFDMKATIKNFHIFRFIDSDTSSMILLLILYTLQGIPMGLSGSIPLILKERNVSYEGSINYEFITFQVANQLDFFLRSIVVFIGEFSIFFKNHMGANCGLLLHREIRSTENMVNSCSNSDW